jgi:sarcosine oxidase, subunit gamma
MSALTLQLQRRRDRLGLKGPRAAEWLVVQGIVVPTAANSWSHTTEISANEALLVARLGTTEFFLEEGTGGTMLKRMAPSLNSQPPGVYPVLREDWAFQLNGERANEVLAQVCNVNFAALSTDSQPLVMTLMIGVAVLVVPQSGGRDAAERHYRIWCDPTFGPYLGESLGAVVIECGGRYTGDAR